MLLLLLVLILLVSSSSSSSSSKVEVNIVKESNDIDKVCVRLDDKVILSYIGYYKIDYDDNNNGNGNGNELKEFDRSSEFSFKVGENKVIKGLNKGIIGTCIGESRQIIIPSSLGYGELGIKDKIPGSATLIFNIYLMDINSIKKKEKSKSIQDLLLDLDNNKDGVIEISEFINWSTQNDIDEQIAMIHFQKADINQDGRIDMIEYKSSNSRHLFKLANDLAANNNNNKKEL
jgi:hypothetical protein